MSHEKIRSRGVTRREFLKALAVVGGGTVLAACAPAATQAPAEAPDEEPAEPAPVEKATVVYWDVSSPEAVDGIAKAAVADRFREKNPDIDLEVSFKPTTGDTQMSETLITAIAAGNPPDAAYFDRFVVPTWAAEGSLTDLTDLAAGAGIKEDDYFPFAWEEASGWKDRLWSLPYDTDDRGLYYNKELVTAAGFDPEDMPVYAEDFDVLADAMFEMDGSRMVTAGFIPWYSQGWLQTYGWSWDGKFWNKDTGEITANDPKIVASAEWVASYAEKYDITSFESFSSAFGSEAQRLDHLQPDTRFPHGWWPRRYMGRRLVRGRAQWRAQCRGRLPVHQLLRRARRDGLLLPRNQAHSDTEGRCRQRILHR